MFVSQRLEELQMAMKNKFMCAAQSGVNLAIRLPDGSKTEYCFPTYSRMKVFINFNNNCFSS